MIMATFGVLVDISRFGGLSVIGGIVGGDWIGDVVEELRPFVVFPLVSTLSFPVSSVKLAFCFLFGKHIAKSE